VRGLLSARAGACIVYKFGFVRLNAKASSGEPVFTLSIDVLQAGVYCLIGHAACENVSIINIYWEAWVDPALNLEQQWVGVDDRQDQQDGGALQQANQDGDQVGCEAVETEPDWSVCEEGMELAG
jgi:hypothetical protein